MTRLAAFYGLACLVTWPLAALYDVSYALPFLGIFGPTVAALLVVGATEGRRGLTALLASLARWRVGITWYGFAILVPIALVTGVWVAHAASWGPTMPFLERQPPWSFLIASLVVGEELGWRGFALPELQRRHSPLTASVILGVAWGLWHLMNFFIPGYPHFGRSLLAFVVATVAYSILFTLLFNRTGSVLLVTLFHATINLASPRGIPVVREQWLEVLVYCLAAALVVWLIGPGLGAREPVPATRGAAPTPELTS